MEPGAGAPDARQGLTTGSLRCATAGRGEDGAQASPLESLVGAGRMP